ncbi:MAG: FRG domain-containing protein [Planctomycetes bacterium]|nr:FRG domain-containing protein [Planctomycetota bacterium]
MDNNSITSVPDYLTKIKTHIDSKWQVTVTAMHDRIELDQTVRPDLEKRRYSAWFRGQANDWPLLPKIFRIEQKFDEVEINWAFRRQSSLITASLPLDDYAGWLFLAQHHGLPTRLLDWTASSAAALFFAIEGWLKAKNEHYKPIVWVLNPHILNWTGSKSSIIPGTAEDEAVNNGRNPAHDRIWSAWSGEDSNHRAPMAIGGRYIHIRMQVQNSRFIIWGNDKRSINDYFTDTDLISKGFLHPFYISTAHCKSIYCELKELGISRSTLFPDLEGIAQDLGDTYDLKSPIPYT